VPRRLRGKARSLFPDPRVPADIGTDARGELRVDLVVLVGGLLAPGALDVRRCCGLRALACLDRLAELGNYEYNWSVGEKMKLNPTWVSSTQAAIYLRTLPDSSREGNLYARRK